MKYYKILRENEKHSGLQFHTGRVDDPLPFAEYGSCVKGGIYFAPVTSILVFVNYGPWIREVTVPEDAQMVKDPGDGPEKYRASSVVLGEREEWSDPVVLQRLIAEGADVYIQGSFALYYAAESGHTETVQVLLEHGANVHFHADALCRAAEHGHTDTVKVLLDAGADIHVRGDASLRWAAGGGHTETVQVLIEHGADIRAQDDEALRASAMNGYTATVRALLEAGADVHVWDNYALWHAEKNEHTETAELLKSYTDKE